VHVRHFSAGTFKILISKNLDGGDPFCVPQNIERLGLTRNILQNKDLGLRPFALEIAATPFGCRYDQTSRLWSARSDVTRLSEKLWMSFVAAVWAWREQVERPPVLRRLEIGECHVCPHLCRPHLCLSPPLSATA